MAESKRPEVRLASFENSWYDPGAGVLVRTAWLVLNAFFLLTWFPWPSALKRALLRAFGARIGKGVVIKPRVNIKYPWKLTVGDYSWVGEGVWIDSLAPVTIGANACLSQGVMIETGNHNWSKTTFDLMIKPVKIEDGAWAAVMSVLLPGTHLASHSVLSGGAVLTGETEPYAIYAGNPAKKVKERALG